MKCSVRMNMNISYKKLLGVGVVRRACEVVRSSSLSPSDSHKDSENSLSERLSMLLLVHITFLHFNI